MPYEAYLADLSIIGEVRFSLREIEVLSCVSHMRTIKKIASFLSISPRTVENHIQNIKHKIGCNSRDGIVDFIEKSDKYLMVKDNYSRLLVSNLFKENCEDISKIFFSNSEVSFSKIPLSIGLKHEHTYLFQIIKKHLYLFNLRDIAADLDSSLEDKNSIDFSIILDEQENYYLAIFHLLSRLFPEHNLNCYREAFEIQCKHLLVHDETLIQQKEAISISERPGIEKSATRLSNMAVLSALTSLIIIVIIYSVFKVYAESPLTKSDLPVPADSAFLTRPKPLAQIEEKLKEQKGIQKIAIVGVVGIGGIGKTTIARQFGRNQRSSIVWELNAETKNSLMGSFKDLAYVLAKTEDQKNELKFICDIKNSEEKEKQILCFVKNILRKNQDWLLIYDNLDSISKMKTYLPQDPEIWGAGRVIITTRDSNIGNSNYIKLEHVIQMDELTQVEALTLFSKILFNCEPNKLESTQRQEVLKFLQHIPPFPLDTTIAAYYLKETKTSYSKYIEYIEKNSEEFVNIQKDFLEDIGDYVKTRYGIITLSLQNLINFNPDFKDLLFFISLLDSQDIPKSLLKRYKNEIVVDDFIYNLKRYSLISNESLEKERLEPSISIHRSTQHISLCYFKKPKGVEMRSQVLQQLSVILASYISQVIERKCISEMKLLVNHGNQFLSHRDILTDQDIGIVGNELGVAYFNMGNFLEAYGIFEEAYNIFKNNTNEQIRAAKIAIYMGAYHRLYVGDIEKAKKLTEYGLKTYEEYYKADHPEIAKALMYSALVHRCLGNYKEAKDLLERSLSIYKKNYGQNNVITAEVMVYLGRINTRLGLYVLAKNIIEQALTIFQENLGENDIEVAWTSVYLAEAYSHLGYYQKAVDLLEKSKHIYKQNETKTYVSTNAMYIHIGRIYAFLKRYKEAKELIELGISHFKARCIENDFRMTWALVSLGNVLMNLDNYKEARDVFQQALKISRAHYGDNHVETAIVLMHLGQNCFKENDMQRGIEFLHESLRKFQLNFHTDEYKVLEVLSDVCLVKSKELLGQRDIEKSKMFLVQSIDYLIKALEIVRMHFPKDSPHEERIQTKLKELYVLQDSYIQN